jgi:hypothetical protein
MSTTTTTMDPSHIPYRVAAKYLRTIIEKNVGV